MCPAATGPGMCVLLSRCYDGTDANSTPVKGRAGTVPPAAGTAGPATAGGVAAGDLYVAAAGCGLGTAAGCTAGTTASTVSLRSGGT
jgi:hypothetical protein